jgi:hypothetical protein
MRFCIGVAMANGDMDAHCFAGFACKIHVNGGHAALSQSAPDHVDKDLVHI